MFRIRYYIDSIGTQEAFFSQMPPADISRLRDIVCRVFKLNLSAFSAEDHDDAVADSSVAMVVLRQLALMPELTKPIYLCVSPGGNWIACERVTVNA